MSILTQSNPTSNRFRIIKTGLITIPAGSINTGGTNYAFNASAPTQIAHGLGYSPAYIGYIESGTDKIALPYSTHNGFTSTSFSRVDRRLAVDDTYIYGITEMWGYNVNTSTIAYTVRYYLLEEQAS